MEKQAGALRVAALDAAAHRAGLKAGMGLADARALIPAIHAADIDRDGDLGQLTRFAAACERFTPAVAIDGDDGLLLDITGCAHLFGGEEALPPLIRRLCLRAGYMARIAVAGTPDAAHAFARFGGEGVTPPGAEAEAARGLPIAAIEADAETHLALSRAGLRSLGDLMERPTDALTARFGGGLTARLRRIAGHEDIRITPLRPLPACSAERHFSEPAALVETILTVFERLAGDISRNLERRGEGGRSFEALVFRTDGVVRRIGLDTAEPCRDPAVLIRLLRLRIDALADPLDPGFGFDGVRLSVIRSEPVAASQADFEGRDAAEDAERGIAGLVDRLTARFGRAQVVRFLPVDTHDPVRAARRVPASEGAADGAWLVEPGHPPLRPLTLFDMPQPIETLAEVPDGPPVRFRWRRLLHEVARAEGPERIAPEWWLTGENAAARDYYRIENARGQRFWVFREGFYGDPAEPPRWFLHGLFA